MYPRIPMSDVNFSKMYGVFDPFIVYGVLEPSANQEGGGDSCYKIIDFDFLQDHDYIDLYTTNVIRNHGGLYVYGYSCNSNENRLEGYDNLEDLKIDDNLKKIVDNFAKKYKLGTPKYYICISGDWEVQKSMVEIYIPEE